MEKHKKPYYKYCVVPMCPNNINTAPDKVYFLMPKGENLRKKWCKAMRRDNVSCLSCLYCCEDHFKIEEDTENYIKYKIMALEHGQKVKLRLKKGVVPHIFQCQKNVAIINTSIFGRLSDCAFTKPVSVIL